MNGTDSHRHVGTNNCEPTSSRNREPVACKASSSDETNLDVQIDGKWVDADVRRLLIGQNSSRLQAVCLHQRRRVRRTGIGSIRQHPSGDYARRRFIPRRSAPLRSASVTSSSTFGFATRNLASACFPSLTASKTLLLATTSPNRKSRATELELETGERENTGNLTGRLRAEQGYRKS